MKEQPNLNIRLIAADLLYVRAKAVCEAIALDEYPARLYPELREAVALYEAAKPLGLQTSIPTTEGTDDAHR
jgi:hypothetical protein